MPSDISSLYVRILARANELANKTMPELRRLACTSDDRDSQYAADQEGQGRKRGDLIEMVLELEFDHEADRIHRKYQEQE